MAIHEVKNRKINVLVRFVFMVVTSAGGGVFL